MKKHLEEIEQEKDVVILYACESGSRAWGFPSQDSDYDVRFLYLNRPEWYLSIAQGRDVIERKHDGILDINGWDILKGLRLFRKSNPSFIEWINSPIIYLDRYDLRENIQSVMHKYFSQTVCSYHYLHMARGNYKDYLKADTVWIKKYFYVLRPLLAVLWMQQGRGIVPTDFNVIINKIDISISLKRELRKLIIEKKAGKELGRGKRNSVISSFIEKELDIQIGMDHRYSAPSAPTEVLDTIFTDLLRNVWKIKL